MTNAEEVLAALIELQKQIREHHPMNVKKDFSLMVADVAASKAIENATKTQPTMHPMNRYLFGRS